MNSASLVALKRKLIVRDFVEGSGLGEQKPQREKDPLPGLLPCNN
jgi:hypothetical protein